MSREEILRGFEKEEARRRNVTKELSWEERSEQIAMDITRKLATASAGVWNLQVSKDRWRVVEYSRAGKFNSIVGTFEAVIDDDVRVTVKVLPAKVSNEPIPREVYVNGVLLLSGDDLRRALGVS